MLLLPTLTLKHLTQWRLLKSINLQNIKLMTTLDLITKEDLALFKSELFSELKKLNLAGTNDHPKNRWLRSVQVRELLHISPGTLQSLRIKGTIPFRKIGGIHYYSYGDIERLLERGENL